MRRESRAALYPEGKRAEMGSGEASSLWIWHLTSVLLEVHQTSKLQHQVGWGECLGDLTVGMQSPWTVLSAAKQPRFQLPAPICQVLQLHWNCKSASPLVAYNNRGASTSSCCTEPTTALEGEPQLQSRLCSQVVLLKPYTNL